MMQSFSTHFAMMAAWNPEEYTLSEQFRAADTLFHEILVVTHGLKAEQDSEHAPLPDIYNALVHVLGQMDHTDAYRKKMNDVRGVITGSILGDLHEQGSIGQQMRYWHQLSKHQRIMTAQKMCNLITNSFQSVFNVYDRDPITVRAGSSRLNTVDTYSTPENGLITNMFPAAINAPFGRPKEHLFATSVALNTHKDSGFDDPLDTMNTLFDVVYREIIKSFLHENPHHLWSGKNGAPEDVKLVKAMLLEGPELPQFYKRADDAHIMTRFIKEQQMLLRQEIFDTIGDNLDSIPPVPERRGLSRFLGLNLGRT